MPAPPPPTPFYENDANIELWRAISREYEKFMGRDVPQWPERQERFVIVLNDMLVGLREPTPTGFG